MWTLVGDPFLRMPSWLPPAPGDGDGNGDGAVNGLDIQLMAKGLTGGALSAREMESLDISGDGMLNDDDLFLISGPLLYGSNDPNLLRGSADLDGAGGANGKDLAMFLQMLMTGEAGFSLRARYSADTNRDGVVDLMDVESFVEVLLTGTNGRGAPATAPVMGPPGSAQLRPH